MRVCKSYCTQFPFLFCVTSLSGLKHTDNNTDADSDSHPKPQVAHGKAESNTDTGADRDPSSQSSGSMVFMAGFMCHPYSQ